MLGQSLMPGSVDLKIYKGDYVEVFVTLTDGGVPVPLTGKTPSCQLKKDYADTDPIDFTCSVVTVSGTPKVRIYMPSSISETLEVRDYIWDFQLVTTSSGDARTYFAGDVSVTNEVTT